MNRSINRRQMLSLAAGTAAGLALGPRRVFGQEAKRKILFFTKSSGFPHSVVTRKDGQPAHAERILTEVGAANGYEVTCTKDGSVFTADGLKPYDAILFYTTEDLTTSSTSAKHPPDDKGPAMPKEGKQLFLDLIAEGKKGFMGFHCATDTFHSKNRGKKLDEQLLRDKTHEDQRDPYIKMIGGEFAGHGSQQKARMRVASTAFPGLEDLKDFEMQEEWYNLHNLSDDLHVILVQDTATMKTDKGGDTMYKRPNYPATWARKHGNGRVFYTSMGHREDVWTNPTFQKVTLAALAWITGKTQFDPKPNVKEATPDVTTFAAAR